MTPFFYWCGHVENICLHFFVAICFFERTGKNSRVGCIVAQTCLCRSCYSRMFGLIPTSSGANTLVLDCFSGHQDTHCRVQPWLPFPPGCMKPSRTNCIFTWSLSPCPSFSILRLAGHLVISYPLQKFAGYVKVSESLTTSWKPRLTLSRRFPPFLLVNNQQLSGSLLFLSLKQPGHGSRSATGRSATAPGLFVQPPSTAGVLKKPFPFSPGRWTTCTVA